MKRYNENYREYLYMSVGVMRDQKKAEINLFKKNPSCAARQNARFLEKTREGVSLL
jgi:hypothetical protein